MEGLQKAPPRLKLNRLIAAALVLLVLFTVIDTVVWYTTSVSFHTEQGGTVSSPVPDGNRLDTSGLSSVRTVVIRFSVPLEKDTSVYLSCGREGKSELSTRETVCPAGSAEVSFSIPQSAYPYIDIHSDLPVSIKSAAVSDGPFVQVQSPWSFRPLFVLLPAALLLLLALLFLRVPLLYRFLLFLDRKILSPDTRWKGITIAYAVFAAAVSMQHVYVTLYQHTVVTAADVFSVPLIVFAVVSILLGKLWKDRIFWVFLVLFCLKVFSTALTATIDFSAENDVFILAAYAFFGAYAVARVLPKDSWKAFLSVFCCLWTLSAVVFAAFGLYTAFTGSPVQNLDTGSFHILDNRLYPVYHPVTGGILLSTAIAVAFVGFALTKHRAAKALYAAAAAILFLAGSPTGARTAYVLTGAEFALLLALAAYDRLKPGRPDSFFRTVGKFFLLALILAVTAAAVSLVQSYAFDAVRLTGAGAEQAVPTDELAHRGFDLSASPDDALAGRLTVWKNVLKTVLESPKNLLLGQSVHDPMRAVNELRTSRGLYEVNHCHNTLLQTLLENGVPGLLLYLCFVIALVFHSLRVLADRSLPLWQRLLPVPALACLIGDLTDCTSHVSFGYPQMTLMFLFAGFTIAISREARKAGKKSGPPEAAAL